MNKKICIVTGATSGIGLATAKAIAENDYCVILACRNREKADRIIKEIIKSTDNKDIYFIQLDLSSFTSIQTFVKEFTAKYNRLDIIINNAGTFCDRRHTTDEGFELTIGTNYIGPYYLTKLLLPIIKKTLNARIVNVASIVGLYYSPKDNMWDFNNIRHGFPAYNTSKLAQILYTIDLAETLMPFGVTVNALHPGVISTNIWQGEGLLHKITKPLMQLVFPSPQKGAETVTYLALSDEVKNTTGKMFANCKELSYKSATLDENLRKELITLTEKTIKEVTSCKKDIAI